MSEKPYPAQEGYFLQVHRDGHWCTWSPPEERSMAIRRLRRARTMYLGDEWRLVKETLTYTVEEMRE